MPFVFYDTFLSISEFYVAYKTHLLYNTTKKRGGQYEHGAKNTFSPHPKGLNT